MIKTDDIAEIINSLEVKDDLDNECCRQPSLYMTVNMQLAEADFEYECASKKLDQLKAQTYINVKNVATAAKVTDATAQAMVTADPDVIAAEEKVSEAKRNKNILFGLVRSLDQKKDMLKSLSFMRRDYTE